MDTPFNERGVSVTRNALSAAGQVFPLREIKDVRVVTVQKNKLVPWAISLVGAVAAVVGGLFASSAGVVVGVDYAGRHASPDGPDSGQRTRSPVEHRSVVRRTRRANGPRRARLRRRQRVEDPITRTYCLAVFTQN